MKKEISAKKTTISVSLLTQRRLAKLGSKGDSYEDIIIRLLEKK